jgi:ribose/xylose/arabinose/galactoside ABC-type transport system permease subunit
MAVGATGVIITGGIDLSVGSVYCLAAVCGAMFLNYFGPAWAGSRSLCLLGCAGCDCDLSGDRHSVWILNGLGVVGLRVHPFVITLGTMAIYRGVAFVMTKAQAFTVFRRNSPTA